MLEEIMMGSLIGAAFFSSLGMHTFWFAPVIAVLYRVGGSSKYDSAYRRVGVPIMFFIIFAIVTRDNLMFLSIFLMWASFTIGYGIPDVTDEGSVLGRYFLKMTNSEKKADFLTRMTVGAAISASMFPLAIHDFNSYIIGASLITFGMPTIRMIFGELT